MYVLLYRKRSFHYCVYDLDYNYVTVMFDNLRAIPECRNYVSEGYPSFYANNSSLRHSEHDCLTELCRFDNLHTLSIEHPELFI